MRIIGGNLKGRQIGLPRGTDIRPTTDMAREALFNIIEHRSNIEEMQVLDLFSGTAAIAFEFISRGCPSVTAVEQNPAAVRGIYRLAEEWKVGGLNIIRTDVFRFLKKAPQQAFDLVFADPPFHHPWLSEIPEHVLSSGTIKPGGSFILEHPPGLDFSTHPHFTESRRYGHVHFTFFSA